MNVILSIKPEYVSKIFAGVKKYEYRKVLFKKDIDIVYIYASKPISKIVGEFRNANTIRHKPAEIWENTKEYEKKKKNFFDRYYDGDERSIAIQLSHVKEFKTPIDIKSVRDSIKAPQSFRYIDFSIR